MSKRNRVSPVCNDNTNGSEMVSLTSNGNLRKYLNFTWIADDFTEYSLKTAVQSNNLKKCAEILENSNEIDRKTDIKKDLLLHEAVKNELLSIFQLLLSFVDKNDDDILYLKDEDGNTVLHCAVEKRRLEFCEALMEHQPATLMEKSWTQEGNNPLHLMVKNKYFDICAKTMKHLKPGYINSYNKKQNNPVHLAARESSKEILELILNNGGNPRAKSKTRYTPLHYAVDGGCADCVSLVLSHIPDEDKEEYINAKTQFNGTALIFAAKKGFTSCALKLKGADICQVDNDGFSALHYAARKGFTSLVKILIKMGADSSLKTRKGNKTVLELAASAGNEQCLLYLLEEATTIKEPQNILKAAVVRNHLRCLVILLTRQEIKSFINHQYQENDNNTLLHISILNSNYLITRELLNNGADKSLLNNRNEYPLHLVAAQKPITDSRHAETERLEECKNILRYSHTFANAVNKYEETPLHLAAKSGNLGMVKSLILKGSKILSENQQRLTPIHVAASFGNDAVLVQLIRFLKPLQLQDLATMKPHPLHLTAKFGHQTTCEIIIKELKMRDKLSVQDQDGLFPVDVAQKHDKRGLFRYLLKQMNFRSDQWDFGCRLHANFKTLIEKGNKEMMEAIIESDWLHVCFDSYYCAHARKPFARKCGTFALLIRQFPDITCAVLDKHITLSDNQEAEIHSYLPLQYIYYNKQEETLEPAFSSNHTLESSAQEFEEVVWGRDHPLMEASRQQYSDVLTHKLVKSWLRDKFLCYTWWLLNIYVLFDFATAVVASVMFALLWNDYHLMTSFNGTNRSTISFVYHNSDTKSPLYEKVRNASDPHCSEFSVISEENEQALILPGSAVWNVSVCAIINLQEWGHVVIILQVVVAVFLILHVALETYFICGTQRSFKDVFNFLRFVSLVCLAVVLCPSSISDFMLGMKQITLWQIGVFGVFLSVLNFGNTLNKVPGFTIFIPVSRIFVVGYLKVITLIFIILVAFSLSFHFLLVDRQAFQSMPYSTIKTTVWMLGDLSYDSTFLDLNAPLKYPMQSKFLFVLFVTTIGGLIFNLILRDPTDQLAEMKEKAVFYQADSMLKLHLLIDDCVPFLRRKFAKSKKILHITGRHSAKRKNMLHTIGRNETIKNTITSNQVAKSEQDELWENIDLKLKSLIQKLDTQQEDINELTKTITIIKKNQEAK